MFAPAKDGAMDLMDLRYLSIVVETGSFSGAAESLGVNPATIMPSFHRTDGLVRVGPTWRSVPVLDARQVEDVVAFLRTLRE